MASLHWHTLDAIKTSIQNYAARLLSGSACILSPDDFVAAFIERDHIPVLKQVQELVGMVGNVSSVTRFVTSDGVHLNGHCAFANNAPPIILPHYVRNGLAPTAPDDVRSRIQNWVDERYRLGRMFGDAWDAINWLNDNCGNAAAIAVMFPALPTLLKNADSDPDAAIVKKAQRIASAKSFGSLPKLPREVKARMIECSDLILTVSMLEAPAYFAMKRGEALLETSEITGTVNDFIYAHFEQTKQASFF